MDVYWDKMYPEGKSNIIEGTILFNSNSLENSKPKQRIPLKGFPVP